MELRVLRYFLAATREGSISAAAQSLHLSQPTLSRQLKELEEQLGKQLLIRGNRELTLSEDGMLLQKRAEEIISLVDKTENEIMASEQIIMGDVYLGGAESDAMRCIAKAMKNTQKEHPLIRFHIFSGNADEVSERLDRGLLDFGVLIEPADIKKYDFIKLLASDTWGLLMRKDSPLALLDSIKSNDLHGLPMICSKQSLVDNEISGWLSYNQDKLNIIATYNLIYNASLLVEEGMGYALCLNKLVNTSEQSDLCFKPLSPSLKSNLNVVWKKHQVFSRASNAFLKQLKNEINQQSR